MQQLITLTNSELKHRISENIHSERDRKILIMRFVDGLTYEHIAEVIQMSPAQIFRIVKRCKKLIVK